VLVKIGEQVFVIGVAEGGMTKLGELQAKDVKTESTEAPRSFASVLARAAGRPSK
jgi:flagellar biogenesis protein FliO